MFYPQHGESGGQQQQQQHQHQPLQQHQQPQQHQQRHQFGWQSSFGFGESVGENLQQPSPGTYCVAAHMSAAHRKLIFHEP